MKFFSNYNILKKFFAKQTNIKQILKNVLLNTF